MPLKYNAYQWKWKLHNFYLLCYDYYYCNQMEMPFEDLNTKMENRPAIGLLREQAEKGKGISASWFQNFKEKKKRRLMHQTNVWKVSQLWPLTYTSFALFITSTSNSQIRFLQGDSLSSEKILWAWTKNAK